MNHPEHVYTHIYIYLTDKSGEQVVSLTPFHIPGLCGQ